MMAAMLLTIGLGFVTLLKRRDSMPLNRNGVVQAKCQIIKVEV